MSFRIRLAGRYLHHNYVVALLNDLFGIQARGGCSCAGPYGHRLLAIDPERSHAYRREIGVGCEGVKPGWARINFHYLVSDAVRDYLTDAVDLLARYGHRLLSDYRFDPHTGLWHHHTGLGEPPLHLTDVHYTAAGITSPDPRPILRENALADHLREAHALLTARSDSIPDGPTGLSAGFEALRWFHLPPQCLHPPPPEQQ